jgi:hypothetical protein
MTALLRKTITHDVEIPLSGNDIADLFWELDDQAQADFFNRLGQKDRLVFQLQAVTDSGDLNHEGRVAMARIGEYSSADRPKP